jgi:hypothetical protein
MIAMLRLGNPGAALVMNASLAFTGGPETKHNVHSTQLSQLMVALHQASAPRQVQLFVPAGNHLQDRIFAVAGPDPIDWVLAPDDRTPSAIEVFQNGNDNLNFDRICVAPPGAAPICLEGADLPQPGEFVDLVADGTAILRLGRPIDQTRDYLVLKARATASWDPAVPVSPSGIWRLTFVAQQRETRLWIRRDDRLEGFRPGGRQSRFLDGAYMIFDGKGDFIRTGMSPGARVSRDQTGSVFLGAQAPGNSVSGIGGIEGPNGPKGAQVYRFSGRRIAAPLANVQRAEETRALGGPVAAGRLGLAAARPPGTSIASALAARFAANVPLSGRRPLRY